MSSWKNKIIHYRFILLLLCFYFFFHVLHLTSLPIFNDEAIYLDWGWTNTHMPGHLYDSLLDAKQPLLIWIFGFFENFFPDPLIAGRFVSVLIGSSTLVGIYILTKKLIHKNAALVAAILYSITPLFVFYNRQALMESAIACVGIWSCTALLNLLRKPTTQNGIILGCVLGIGFFIKSSTLLFIIASGIIVVFYLFKYKNSELLKAYGISVLSLVLVNILLFINPIFWQTFSSNSRYSYTIAELFTFPLRAWGNSIFGFFEISFLFITPFIFILSLFGIVLLLKTKNEQKQLFLAYFLLALVLELFSVKLQSTRYIISFLPFLIIPSAFVLSSLWSKNIRLKIVVLVFLFIPTILSLVLIFNPNFYITQFSKISKYSVTEYIHGQTSGYGITETIQYIKDHSSPSQQSLVFFGLNAGNPESSISVYANQDLRLIPLHINAQILPGIEQYQCITSRYPVFLVTRDDQLLGMERYFSFEKSFPNPDGKYSVGIYGLKNNCVGKTLVISDVYQEVINKVLETK